MKKITITIILVSIILQGFIGCIDKDKTHTTMRGEGIESVSSEPAITFIELGSDKCVPCKMMQPIIEEITEEYSGTVQVLFYDVWTEEGSPYSELYNIKAIPTQVFLDKNGEEYFRHVGFLPKEELEKILKMKL